MSKAQRRAAVELATEVAQKIVERKDIDSATLEAVASGLETSRNLLDGCRGSGDLDREVAEVLRAGIGTVERGNIMWHKHVEIAEEVLRTLQPDERGDLIRRTEWADDDVLQSLPAPNREPWQDDDVPMRTLSAPETDEIGSASVGAPPEAQIDGQPVEIVEAELVDEPEEIEQTTTSQRRFKMPEGQSYAPGRRFGQALGGDHRVRERAAAQRQFGADIFLSND